MKIFLFYLVVILSLRHFGGSGYSIETGAEVSVYFSNGSHILNFTTAGGYTKLGILPLTQRNHSRIVGLAVDVDDGRLFWSDISVENRGIYTTSLKNVDEKKIIADCGEVHGLAVDWLSNQLYWTDTSQREVLVSDYDGKFTKTIAFSGMLWPRGIVVDPIHSTIYWGDQGSRTIQHAQLDGSERGTLVKKGIYWPNQLTVSYSNRQLYWVDAWNKTVWSCDLDGNNPQVQYDLRDSLQANPLFGIATYGTTMYLSTWYNGAIYSTDLGDLGTKNSSLKLILEGVTGGEMFSIAVASRAAQPSVTTNFCDQRADCSHFCFTRKNMEEYVCSCPTYGGLALALDNRTCSEPSHYLFWTKKNAGYVGFLNPTNMYSGDTYLVAQSSRPVAVAYDPVDKYVYWSDVHEKCVYRAYVNGTSKQLFLPHSDGVGVVDGLAVDWKHRRLYFTNRKQPGQERSGSDFLWHKIEMVGLDGTGRWTVTTQAEKPRGLVVDGEKGYLYYTDWGRHPKVVRTELDGANPIILRDTNISNPNSLSLFEKKLYLVDSNYHQKAERRYVAVYDTEAGTWVDLDGLLFDIRVPLSIAATGEHIILSEWSGPQEDMGRMSIYSLDNGEKHNLSVYGNPTGLFYSIATVNQTENVSLVCPNNICEDICIPTPDGSSAVFRCQCSDLNGKVLSKNGYSCIAPENFLLFADLNTIKLINLENPGDEHIYTLVQGSYNANYVALVYEQKGQRIFWADLKSPRLLTVTLSSPYNVSELLHLDYAINSMVIVDQSSTRATNNFGGSLTDYSGRGTGPIKSSDDHPDLTSDLSESSDDHPDFLTDQSGAAAADQFSVETGPGVDDGQSGMINDQFIAESEQYVKESSRVTDMFSNHSDHEGVLSGQAIVHTNLTTNHSAQAAVHSSQDSYTSGKVIVHSNQTDVHPSMAADHVLTQATNCSNQTMDSPELTTCLHVQSSSQSPDHSGQSTDLSGQSTDHSNQSTDYSDPSGQSIDHSKLTSDRLNQTTMIPGTDDVGTATESTRPIALPTSDPAQPSQGTRYPMLYWVGHNSTVGLLACAELDPDGHFVPRVLTTGLRLPRGLTVDAQHGFIYWTEYGLYPSIKRVTLGGHHMETVTSTGLRWPNSIIVHPAPDTDSSFLLVADGYYKKIEKMGLDGQNRHQVALEEDLSHIYGMALLGNRLLFFSDWIGHRIGYVDMETGQMVTMATGLFRPTSMAFQILSVEGAKSLFSLTGVTEAAEHPTPTKSEIELGGNSTYHWQNETSTTEGSTVKWINTTESATNKTISTVGNTTEIAEQSTSSWLNSTLPTEETAVGGDNTSSIATEESATYNESTTTLAQTTFSIEEDSACEPPKDSVIGGHLECEYNYCHLVCSEETHRINPKFTWLAVPGVSCVNGTWGHLPAFFPQQSCLEIRMTYRVQAEYKISLKGKCVSDETSLVAKMKEVIVEKMIARGICSSLSSGDTSCLPQLKLDLNCHRKQKIKKKLLEFVSSSTQKKRHSQTVVTSLHSKSLKFNSLKLKLNQKIGPRPKISEQPRNRNVRDIEKDGYFSASFTPSVPTKSGIYRTTLWAKNYPLVKDNVRLDTANNLRVASDTKIKSYPAHTGENLRKDYKQGGLVDTNGKSDMSRKLSTRSLREVPYNSPADEEDTVEVYLTLQIDVSGSPNEENISKALKAAAASLQDLVSSGEVLRVDGGQFESIPESLMVIDREWTCPEGQIKVEDVCVACPRGSFQNDSTVEGVRECSVCEPGTYQDVLAQTTCKLCPVGALSAAGSIDILQCLLVTEYREDSDILPMWNLVTVIIIASGIAAVTFSLLTCFICITHRRDRKVILSGLKDSGSTCTKSTSDLSDYGETYDLREMRLYRNRMTSSQPDLLPMELICAWNPHDIPGTSTTSIPRSSTLPEQLPGGADSNTSRPHSGMWEHPIGAHRPGRRLRTFRPKSGDLSVTFSDEKKSSF